MGQGNLIGITAGFFLIILGIILIIASALITSEEGLDLPDDDTPEGKAVTTTQTAIMAIGAILAVFGIIVILVSVISAG